MSNHFGLITIETITKQLKVHEDAYMNFKMSKLKPHISK